MGRIYRPVEVEYGDRKATTVAIIDTGADETVISERLAGKVNSDLYGVFKAICASDTILEGKYADVMIRKLWSGVEIIMTVGVSDKPFGTDDIDDEGVEAIFGLTRIPTSTIPPILCDLTASIQFIYRIDIDQCNAFIDKHL